MEEQKKIYLQAELDDTDGRWSSALAQAKENTGIQNTSDLIRHLITKCAKEKSA